MDEIKYRPFVKRLDLSVLGDEQEPIIFQMPSEHSKLAAELNPEIVEWNTRSPAGADIERILVTGLGAQEGYGPNVNGDGFHEDHLLAVPKDVFLGRKPYDKPMYKSFIDFSKLYKYHKNRMHDQAYGEIPNAFYNAKMRRVEIPIDLFASEKSNIDILENLARNIFPAVSMGFRCVPGDVCSVCLNYDRPFPTRAHYCDHLKNNMLQIDLETGILCYAINHNGYFFDLSIIGKPADRIAWGMRRLSRAMTSAKADKAIIEADADHDVNVPIKTASELGMDFIGYSSKFAEEDGTTAIVELMEKDNLEKEAEISVIPDGIINVLENDPDPYFRTLGVPLLYRTDVTLSKDAMNYMAKNFNLKTAFATMVSCGILPKPQEFQRMVLVSVGQEKYADYLDKENIVFDMDAVEEPDYTYDTTTGEFDPKLAEYLRDSGILDQRSYYAPFLMKRAAMIKEALFDDFFKKYPMIPNPLPRKKLPEDYQQRMITQGMAASPQGQYYQKYPNPVMSNGRYVSPKPEGVTTVHKSNPIIPLAILGAMFAGGRWLARLTSAGPLSRRIASNPIYAAGAFGTTAAITWLIGRAGIPKPKEKIGSIIPPKAAMNFGSDYVLHFLAGIAISYGLAGRAESKREIGMQPNILEEAAEKSPGLGAALIGIGTGTGARALIRKFASEELENLENGIMKNDYIIGEYSLDYLDKMARLSLNHSALLIKR